MPAIIFDSKPLVTRMTEELQSEAKQFRKQHRRSARLAQLIVGHDAAEPVGQLAWVARHWHIPLRSTRKSYALK